jgi:hypothetical protein
MQHVEHQSILAYSDRAAVDDADRLPTFKGWSFAVALAAMMWAGIGLGCVMLYNTFHG